MFSIFLVTLFCSTLFAAEIKEEWQKIVDLRGSWKFSIGDNYEWANPGFNDSEWDNIFAPAQWEEEGYPGYDGYAWYRKSFTVKEVQDDLYLHLGHIDDVDEVFVNGKMIGLSGSFPPDYNTAYNVDRRYHIPATYLNKDKENIIAVRVFDAELSGGLVYGKLGVYQNNSSPSYIKSLEGVWKFTTGDSKKWISPDFDESHWENILVPMTWEVQGYKHYNGYAWYRIRFKMDPRYQNERLVLMLGRIDDFDEVYLNGKYVGGTGDIEGDPWINEYTDEWLVYRDYELEDNLLNFAGENVLAVRVYDGLEYGGIYEGPIGIISYDEYLDWRRGNKIRKKINIFDFFKWFNNDN